MRGRGTLLRPASIVRDHEGSRSMGSAVLGKAIHGIRDFSMSPDRRPDAAVGGAVFGSLVFNEAEQEKRLPKTAYHALRRTVTQGQPLDASVADAVASALKDWAV